MIDRRTAGDLMHTELIAVRPDTPLREVAWMMAAHGLDVVPVVDDAGQLVGILTDDDLAALLSRTSIPADLPSEAYLG
jgi:CBS domain-containing protein